MPTPIPPAIIQSVSTGRNQDSNPPIQQDNCGCSICIRLRKDAMATAQKETERRRLQILEANVALKAYISQRKTVQ
jgi:hypothetical protein